jgi:hypothetical protein
MPPVGNPSQVLPAASNMIPSQKVGVAQAISEKIKAPVSRAVFRFHPASKPKMTPKKIASICPKPMSGTVSFVQEI